MTRDMESTTVVILEFLSFPGNPQGECGHLSYLAGWETVRLRVIWEQGTQGQQLYPSITQEPMTLSCLLNGC